MKITALVENISDGSVRSAHGLSFYIETKMHKLLFDVGPNSTLFENAVKKHIDLSQVDTVIISHGHKDHGGALKRFLQINRTAKIYLQKSAFENVYYSCMTAPHYDNIFVFMYKQILFVPKIVADFSCVKIAVRL